VAKAVRSGGTWAWTGAEVVKAVPLKSANEVVAVSRRSRFCRAKS
jgi:hypothetical protein